jgi:hypothetical protein
MIRMIMSRWMKWAGHVARMREKGNACKVLAGKSQRKRPLGRPRLKRRIISRWILEKQDGVVWNGLIWLKIGHVEGFCESGNEASGSIKCWEFLEYLNDSLLLNDSAPWS